MCYSAEVWADYRNYLKQFPEATTDIKLFVELYVRKRSRNLKTPLMMDRAFAKPHGEQEQEIHDLIVQSNDEKVAQWEQELFKQAKRLADAKRTLQTKTTKKALNDQRIATNKIGQLKTKIADLKRTEVKDRDNRIFPEVYAPVLVMEDGKMVVKPMRYGLRLNGKPSRYDTDFSGTYNARRNSLEGYWKTVFGRRHGIIVAERFYENVEGADGKNEVLKFTPRDNGPMFIACLWDHWVGKGKEADEPDLYSFAAITDDPEPEVAAAGHDRTIINIKPEHIQAWLTSDPENLEKFYEIFDDKQHPYYEHRKAA